jgi:hypothetical protein
MTDVKAEGATAWRRTEGGSLASDPIVNRLIDACVRMGRFQPHELLRWLVDDVLADFGVRSEAPPDSNAIPWLRENTARFAEAVIRHPFGDVMGMIYQALSSRWHRGALGQFFTPTSVSRLIAEMLMPAPTVAEDQGTRSAQTASCERASPPAEAARWCSHSWRRSLPPGAGRRCGDGPSPGSIWTRFALECVRGRSLRTSTHSAWSWVSW